MSNVKISALPVGAATSSTPFPAVVGGVTDQVTLAPVYTSLDGKAALAHTHAESDITNLTTDLAGKAAISPLTPTLTPMNQSTWAWTNQGTASVTQSDGVVKLTAPSVGGGENFRVRSRVAPATPYKFATLMTPGPWYNNTVYGLGLRESGTGKICIMGANISVSTALFATTIRKMTNATTLSSQVIEIVSTFPGKGIFLRVGADGTNVTYEYSFDSFNWITALSELKAAFFTTAPDEICITAASFLTGPTAATLFLSLEQI